MRKLICLFVLAMVSLVTIAQTSTAQERNKDDFEKMSFEVKLNNSSYLPLEPIFVKFKFSNQTEFSITTDTPNFLLESKIRLNLKEKIQEINWLSSITGGGVRFPQTYKPDGFYEAEEILGPAVGCYFTKPGTYQLQFILRSSDGTKTIESNTTNIKIENPTGINKEAFDFMKKHEEFFGISSWTADSEKSENLLEMFVSRYGQSVYGKPAISSLGYLYKSRGEFDKAKFEFEKLKNSEHKTIAEDATRSLIEIERKKAALEKPNQ